MGDTPIAGWFIMDNPINIYKKNKWMFFLGLALFSETPRGIIPSHIPSQCEAASFRLKYDDLWLN